MRVYLFLYNEITLGINVMYTGINKNNSLTGVGK